MSSEKRMKRIMSARASCSVDYPDTTQATNAVRDRSARLNKVSRATPLLRHEYQIY